MKRLLYFVLIGFLFGCGSSAPAEPSLTPSPTPLLCLGLNLVDGIICTQIDETNAILLSQGEDAITITKSTLDLSIRGEVQLRLFEDRLVINALRGSIVVNVDGSTRVLRGRQRVVLPIEDGVFKAPEVGTEPIAVDELTDIAIERTPRPTDLDSAESTAEATEDTNITPEASEEVDRVEDDNAEATEETDDEEIAPTATRPSNVRINIDDDCEPRSSWTITYTVVAGDVLEFIARDFGTTVQEMAIANCLANPGVLVVGQELRVPRVRPTLTPNTIEFRSDETTIDAGDCTTLRWNAYDARGVFLDEEQTTAVNTRRVCPSTTRTYQLLVTYRDDSEATREVTITVSE